MQNIRYQKLLNLMKMDGYDFIAINPGVTFKYLTKLDFHLMERPIVLIISQTGKNALILPELEVSRAKESQIFDSLFPYGDNPATWHTSFDNAVDSLKISYKSIAVEPNRFRFLEYEYLKESCPLAPIKSGTSLFEQLRLIKEMEEIEEMVTAARIAETALEATLASIKSDVTEKEIASELVLQCLKAGADSEFPFPPIVAFGENSANPHASPSDREIRDGDVILFDWGVYHNGYASDITRCFAFKKIEPEIQKIANIVLSANETGRAAGKPDMQAGHIDLATRKVIENAGYGEYFTHRTGHGLGMEAHEGPYIYSENDLLMKEGMTYTIEPGIYLPGKGGIRIEDDVVVTQNGSKSITNMDRNLKIIS
ncbi:MAG: aminopeptidase P family protein [Anaerolineaceae bacterium]